MKGNESVYVTSCGGADKYGTVYLNHYHEDPTISHNTHVVKFDPKNFVATADINYLNSGKKHTE